MNESTKCLRIMIWLHVILGPIGVFMMVHDYHHPEVWEDWTRNPMFTIPFCLLMELFIWRFTIRWVIKESRMAKGLRCLAEALNLQKQGRHDESYAAYLEGCRLTGRKPR